MESFGSIIDKISILEKRISVTQTEKNNVEHLYNQYGWLLKTMGEILVKNFEGKQPFTFSKNKNYDNDVSIDLNMTFLEAIKHLNDFNIALWKLEDIRRDETKTDKERLSAADSVSVHNKLRNDCIDQIDLTIQRAARSSHGYLLPFPLPPNCRAK
tara:strand:+ start:7177 stop:7644 length:468 start_codon:yes stop_codon:yes gene_type:complete